MQSHTAVPEHPIPSYSPDTPLRAVRSTPSPTARLAGSLILVATASYLVGSALVNDMWDGPQDLGSLGSHEGQLYAGVILQLLNAAAVATVGVLVHRLIRRHDETVALGYVIARTVEAVLVALSAIVPLLWLALSQTADPASGATAAVLDRFYDLSFQAGMLSLGLGSLALCGALYRYRLVPTPLAVGGFLGYLALIASVILEVSSQDAIGALYVPGAIFEVAFPVWLITKGLRSDLIVNHRAAESA